MARALEFEDYLALPPPPSWAVGALPGWLSASTSGAPAKEERATRRRNAVE